MGACERRCLLLNLLGFVLAILLTVIVAVIITLATGGIGALTIPAILAIVGKVVGPLTGGTAILLTLCLMECGVAEQAGEEFPQDVDREGRARGRLVPVAAGRSIRLTTLILTGAAWLGGLLVHYLA